MVKSINEPETPTVEATEPKSINEPAPAPPPEPEPDPEPKREDKHKDKHKRHHDSGPAPKRDW